MINKYRRKMIFASTLISFSGVTFGKGLPFYPLKTKVNPNQEFSEVYAVWISVMGEEPAAYLMKKGIHDLDNKRLLKEMSVKDFESGATLSVNGFVLSYTEAAAAACIGSAYINSGPFGSRLV
ncbi:hypothetical protein A9Q81_11365 [Gammaproteobacteria bacterium 42_54_T18]|nr:hypothetical protein A9Q81_11365 [Gammaproteobacteria bacterium 42_54_T18]